MHVFFANFLIADPFNSAVHGTMMSHGAASNSGNKISLFQQNMGNGKLKNLISNSTSSITSSGTCGHISIGNVPDSNHTVQGQDINVYIKGHIVNSPDC
jgi:hypothetical protein